MSEPTSAKPVIYVHARGHGQITEHSVKNLLESGMPVCSRLKYEGLTQTENGYDHPGLLIAELAGLFPGRPIIFLRAGLQLSEQLLGCVTGLLAASDQPYALTMLSNADSSVNPFAGLQAPPESLKGDPGEFVRLLAPGLMHELTAWTDHFVLLSAELVSRMSSEIAEHDLMHSLRTAGGVLLVSDHLFLHDPESRLFTPIRLQPHESAYPPPFCELSSRLQQWFNAGLTSLPLNTDNQEPGTLHITHSWGGGVAQWLKSFIETSHKRRNFQLRSEDPQTGPGFGQKISLYAGNEMRCPIASWWLTPPIESIDDSNTGYREILSEICSRYNIGRVFISSLVGHSLDALRTGRPTLQILHDHFPVWPLLSVNPQPYLQDGGPPNLKLALQEHAKTREFPDKDAQAWMRIREAYVLALKEYDVKIAAPGQSVIGLQNQLEPAFKSLTTEIIPHGLPVIEGLQAITPKPRKDGRRRMLILGRMQTGKGQQLLSRALPELAKHVQVYLLGTGKSGEAFFGTAGVDVILEYKREELASIVAEIGPDFAALLSIVPETFSFTLSELQQMHIPVVATRVGSFPDRIEHGKTGWLVDANPQDLVRQVADLCNSPEQVDAVRTNLDGIKANTLEEMLKAFNNLCPMAEKCLTFIPASADLSQVQQAAADYQYSMADTQLKSAAQQKAELKREVSKRTEWALETGKQLKHEQKRRKQWVNQLNSEITRLKTHIEEKQIDLESKEKQLAILTSDHLQLKSDYQRIEAQNTLILGSTSWKITRPLRAGRRAAKNFMLARAWNPARWPWLLSQLIRNLSTLGIKGTLQRLQYTGSEAAPEPQPVISTEVIGNIEAPSAFPETDKPEVSIIIPVYNKWVYTAACLRSLLKFKGKYAFEVIVVDDQSSDETAERLAAIDGLTHLRNEKNLGFVGSCNHGARHARGEYLVLLNNDTQVLQGWLDELIDTFEREPLAGLVGARLVYPDGSLQESGGIIFNDGSGWNFGREKQAENPEFLFLREVDYCSGACIALKTEYFLQIGAFDERYAPAYYEDTDLAFRVRESGLKVFIQPLSVVIHHEGITSGTDTASGAKKYQLINQKKFVDRWQSELKSQPDKISNPDDHAEVLRASRHRSKGNILIIDATTPEPDKDSGSVRLTNMMQCCRELGFSVTFFADNRDYAGSYTRDLQKSGIEVLYHPWLESLHDFFRQRGGDFDYVFISRHYIATNYISLLRRYCPDTHFIFDTVDLHYLREQRLAELEQSLPLERTARQTRRAELSVIKAADATLVVSTVEKTVLAEDAPGEKVHVLSNIHEVPGRDRDFADRKDIYFVGGYQHPPNVDAACWFVNDIWPLIHKQLPEMQFHLIGSKAPERIRSLSGDGVIFHGFVESLQPFLSNCRLAVAPLRYGAGVKGKVNMSMAHGQPVVATPAAVEGMFAEHERELLVADDAESFAAEVVRLYQDEDLWNRLSDASVQNVEEHFSLATARASLTALFDSFDKKG
jgi:GT2 family glycosyltransferase/glycosyltransferase involved in cell wall biosynthesis